MLITLKDILKSNRALCFTLLFSCFYSINSKASEEVTLRKYGYGKLYWNGVLHKKPELYPLLESKRYITPDTPPSGVPPFYKTSDLESENMQLDTKVILHLSINQKNGDVFAIVKIENNSTKSYFMSMRNLPKFNSKKMTNSLPCSEMFLITADNIRLDYLGGKCSHSSYQERDSWVEIFAGKSLSYRVKLNDTYEFPSGKMRYNIGTLEYSMVNEKWFIEQNSNVAFFSIMNKNEMCDEEEYSMRMINPDKANCSYADDADNIEGFLSKYNFNGGDLNGFILRSNQIITEIDGDEIR